MVAVKNKISSFIFDIVIVCLCYIYFMTCSLQNFESKYRIVISHDTFLKIDEHINHYKKHKLNHSFNEIQVD